MIETEIGKRIPELIKALNSIKTEYAYEQVFIGEAISLLLLLKDHLNHGISCYKCRNAYCPEDCENTTQK